VPFKGGEYFTFFSPVFNIADSSIFIGVVFILIFQKKFFKEHIIDESKSHDAHLANGAPGSVLSDPVSSNPPGASVENPDS
jgi:signal peptidase II